MPAHPDLPDSAAQRQTMVDCQVRTFGVTDQRLIARLLAVPRERFLPDDVRGLAYSDIVFTVPLSGDDGARRTLLPPLVLARLIQGGRVRPGDRVLDVAGGLGYGAAILAGLASGVVALESDAALARDAETRLADIAEVRVRTGELAGGAADGAPFDVIVLNGAVETDPETLLDQLADGGRLLTIRRSRGDATGRAAKAVCYEKRDGLVGMRSLFDASAPVLPDFRHAAGFVF